MELQVSAGGPRDRLPGDVVLGRSQSPGGDHDVGSPEGRLQGGSHPAEVVTDGGLLKEVEPEGGQLAGDECGIGVDDLTQEELRADTDDLCAHGVAPAW